MKGKMTDRLWQQPADDPDPIPAGLAASWYIAMPSAKLRGKVVAFQLFGRQVIAWRDGSGRPVVAARHCPHQGASLALGKVVDGCLRCPFHGWRFDGSGACVEIPGSQRIPATARLWTYPTVERYGWIWAWYGSAEPMFELPGFPALEEEKDRYLGFRYTDWTAGHPRQLLENAFDWIHFQTLHSLPLERTEFRVLRDPQLGRDNGPPIDEQAFLGGWMEGVVLAGHPLRRPRHWLVAAGATFFTGDAFQLLIDGWPGGQRYTGYVGGKEIFKYLMGITPIAEGSTIQRAWTGVRRTDSRLRTWLNVAMLRGQSRVGTRQDMPIYDYTHAESGTTRVRYDSSLIRFRRYYQSWVERVDPALISAGRP